MSLQEINNVFPQGTRFTEQQIESLILKHNLDVEIDNLLNTDCSTLPAGALAGPAPTMSSDQWNSLSGNHKATYQVDYGMFIQRQCEIKGYHLQKENTDVTGNDGQDNVYLFLLGVDYNIMKTELKGKRYLIIASPSISDESYEPVDRTLNADGEVCNWPTFY